MDRLEQILGRIDRRFVYLGLAIFTLLPLVFEWKLPILATGPVKSLFQAIETLPPGKAVLLGTDWDAGTQPENRPQTLALTRHMIRKRIRFGLLSVGRPQSPQLSQDVVEEAIRLEKARNPQLDFRYGRDFVNLGYKELTRPWLLSFIQDPHQQVKVDWKNKPLSGTFLAEVRQFGRDGQIAAFVDITGSATIDEWRPLLYPRGVKVGLACTAVMAPEQYPFLANNQMVGMLTGLKGAADYEQLLGYVGKASEQMPGQSFAHLYILLLLILGNIAIVAAWFRRGTARRGGGASG